jgi:hypothetical protein
MRVTTYSWVSARSWRVAAIAVEATMALRQACCWLTSAHCASGRATGRTICVMRRIIEASLGYDSLCSSKTLGTGGVQTVTQA